MNPIRLTAVVILGVSCLPQMPAIAAGAQDTHGVAIKILIGGHVLTQDTGVISETIPDSTEDSGGVLANFTILGRDGGRRPFGAFLELEGNKAKAGPSVGLAGVQTFGIVTVRIMAQMEVRLKDPQNDPDAAFQPYVSLGAGWNFHSAGEKIEFFNSPPPPGTPLALDLDDSPALRAGAGFHRRVTRAGLSVNLEGGLKWDAGDFSMRIQDQPARRGSYDLSGVYVLFGITLRP